MYKPVNARALYTGGGIWIFLGRCEGDSIYYIVTDDGFVLIVDMDPMIDFDKVCGDIEWEKEHTIVELMDKERFDFSQKVLKILDGYYNDPTKQDELGGISNTEIFHYKKVFGRLLAECIRR